MITLTKNGNAIVFTFSDNAHYLFDGTIEVPVNSLTLITDNSQMATFKKSASNDVFISATYAELGMSKSELESWFKENACGSTGGGASGITSGEVQSMIDASISGKANTSAVTAVDDALTAHTADTTVHVTSADKTAWNAKSDFSGSYNDLTDKPTIPTVPTSNTAFTNDAGYITSGEAATQIEAATSGKADTTAVTEAITAAVSGKADTSSVYTKSEVDTALSGKQDTLIAGSGITISGNVISSEGGNKVVELTQAQYDALVDKDPDTFYIITDASAIDINNYYTKTAVDGLLSTKANTATTYNKTEVDNALANKADTSAVTEAISSAVSGKVNTSAYNAYTAATDSRLAEDEEVTAAGLNALNDALGDKADTSAVTASIAAAVSGKQDTLIAGSGITISGNVISSEGGSSINVVQTTGTSTTDVMSQDAVTTNLKETLNTVGVQAQTPTSNYTQLNLSLRKQNGSTTQSLFTYVKTINGNSITSQVKNNLEGFSLIETSAITTSITSSSTDAQIPSAKAVNDKLGGLSLVKITQAAYDALVTKDPNTLYVIVD